MSKYNTFMRRFGAICLDNWALMPLSWLNLIIWRYVESPMALAGWLVLQTLLYHSYSILMHGLYGQTLGKMVCRIKVLDVSGAPLSMRQAMLRDLIPIVIGVYFFSNQLRNILNGDLDSLGVSMGDVPVIAIVSGIWMVLELVTMFSNDQRRSIHDYIAGSVVVRHPWNEEKGHYIGGDSPFSKRVLQVLIAILLLNAILSPQLRHNWPKKEHTGSASATTPDLRE